MRRVLAALLVLAFAAPAAAQRARNPYDQEVARLARSARQHARDPRAFVEIAEIHDLWEAASPGAVTRALSGLSSERRLPASARAYADALRARLWIREGQLDQAAAAFRRLGYVTRFRVVGPFDNEGKVGFARAYGPESDRNAPVNADARYPGREREVGWRTYPEIARWGYVSLDAVMRPTRSVCGYAETFVELDEARPITLWVGAGGATRVWFNGEPVIEDGAYRSPDFDRSVALVAGRRGANRVLVKVCNTDRPIGFYLRLGDAQGAPLAARVGPDLAQTAASAPASAPRLPTAPAAPLASLLARVADRPEDAQAHENLARFLQTTYADDPDERRALAAARRAFELRETWQRALLVADLVSERAEVMRAVSDAERLAPREAEVIYARAALTAGGPDPDRALALLEPLRPNTTRGLLATLFRANILRGLELPQAGLAEIERGLALSGGAVRWQRARLEALRAMGRLEPAAEANAALLEASFDDLGARRWAVRDAMFRHDRETALRHIDAMRALLPDREDVLHWAAAQYEALQMNEQALGAYREAIELAPDGASAHVALGNALLRRGERDAAAASLRRALVLRPQDERTRALLDDISPSQREDEAYATPVAEVLARRSAESDYSARVLHDLTVNTVFENGLSSSYHQVFVQVHDDEGARGWRAYSIPYDPSSQYVEVRGARVHRGDRVLESVRHGTRPLGDPRYRIYYSRQAHVVRFPDLEPGDTIELTYRVTDVSFRNVFNDYYGDFRVLARSVPTARLEYVLVTPPAREFHFNEPQLPNLQHTRREVEGHRVDRFVANDIAAVRSEPMMPGPSETLPYLHVSTYRTWEEVGRWWWGLVQDQLVVEESLRRTVAEVTAGATTVRERVERIYAWVVNNTRYVGLEFGIHGFQPYRVPLIVQRGFGDCKDKASLLYVMLREAGIDARLVLVRTRRNGRIDDLPASLAVFDHAIAYVPELDLYLDGTAENGGTNALPTGDQGVTVLVVGPDGAELRRTPVSPPTAAGRRVTSTLALTASGEGTLEVEQEVFGPSAAAYRTRYQAAARRVDRLEAALRDRYPSVEIQGEPAFDNLDELEQPVRMRYTARAPQLAQREGGSLLVPPSNLRPLAPGLGIRADRTQAVDLGGTSTYTERRVIRPPDGSVVEDLPAGGVAESAFGRVRVTYQRRGRDVVVESELTWLRDRVEQNELRAFVRWLSEADALLRARIRIGGLS